MTFCRFASSVRGAIRKAEKRKLLLRFATPVSRSRRFKLHVRTRRRHGLPPQPMKFFLNIHEESSNKVWDFVVLARTPIGSGRGSGVSSTLVKAPFISTERRTMSIQELRGNDLVMWEAIKFLAKGLAQHCTLAEHQLRTDGLRRFKTSAGGM